MDMNLNIDQHKALLEGQAVPIVIGGAECVVIRKDAYERATVVSYDASDWTASEIAAMSHVVCEDGDKAGPIP